MEEELKNEEDLETCIWNCDYGVFEAGCCDTSFMMWYNFKYCPYCGKKIRFKRT